MGLRADGSIVGWGYNYFGQANVPSPNAGFIAIASGYYHNLAIRLAPGDFNGDGLVGLADYPALLVRMAGPSETPATSAWRFFDFDLNDRVDLRDAAHFMTLFTGD